MQVQVRHLDGPAPYEPVWQAMKSFTEARHKETPDEIWLVEHCPVYTLGQAGKPEHLLNTGAIEVVQCNRGGQVTYHGPGQLVVYPLVDLRRQGIYVKEYVALIEDVVLDTLASFGLQQACRKAGAPGVYVPLQDGSLAKIAALGVKISQGCAYHGLALNVDMDLQPFAGINPCGYAGLQTVDLKTMGVNTTVQEVGMRVLERLLPRFS
ncbi:lipoyl(octanoyl) transferase [Advenella incenata]|uniref:Octanoyltransferase n=1 Tax=Advenella incenata TaxID=267800 RepID=A0A4Q7VS73_9BURK|nr:lipoyl(octanoyl) transferase LipB [Advenella incenata]RZT99098.1 lipoyl(octanoyl) transferase [Advenella incenata]